MTITAQAISTITDKVWSLVEAWQSRPLAAIYPFVFLNALHLKLRREGKPEAARKLLYLVTMDITRRWTAPVRNWAIVLNQRTICFEDRLTF